MLGYSVGGICRRFLVAPPSMIWPANLVTSALFNTLHSQETMGTHSVGGVSRERFFVYVFVGYIFYSEPFSSWKKKTFPFILIGCRYRLLTVLPLHRSLDLLLGLLDNSQQCQSQPVVWRHSWLGHGRPHLRLGSDHVQWLPSSYPLVGCRQHWSHHRLFLLDSYPHSLRTSSVLSRPFRPLSISSQYTNVWYSAYLPLVSSHSFDNTGARYNVTKIVNADASFNAEAYKAYSPLFISASFAMAYGLSFASISATLTHTFLYYRKQIYIQARRSLSEQPDIHARLMSVYKEVPDWWYLTIFGSCTKSDCKSPECIDLF
jgi:hypothetical protein